MHFNGTFLLRSPTRSWGLYKREDEQFVPYPTAQRNRHISAGENQPTPRLNEREAPLYNSHLQVIFASEGLNNG